MSHLVEEQPEIAVERMMDNGVAVRLLDILLVMVHNRLRIFLTVLAFMLLGVAAAIVIKPSFIATAVILPPQQSQSSLGGLGSQAGSLGALAAVSSLGLKSPEEMYMGFLKSRTIADRVIAEFHLKDIYKAGTMYDLRKILASHTEISAGKDGLIHINVTDHDPKLASEIANGYVSALSELNASVAVTEAGQRRLFFDKQIDLEKDALVRAEEMLRVTQEKTGLIQLNGQTQEAIRSIADIRAQISASEVKLQSLLMADTDQNPDVIRARQQIAALRGQLAMLQKDDHQKSEVGDITVPTGRIAKDELEYARQLREVKYHEALFDFLSKQGEIARIDEAKAAPIVQVIDRALPPDRKSGPKRLLLVLGFGFVGFVVAALWVMFKFLMANLSRDPDASAKLQQLSDGIRLRRRARVR